MTNKIQWVTIRIENTTIAELMLERERSTRRIWKTAEVISLYKQEIESPAEIKSI